MNSLVSDVASLGDNLENASKAQLDRTSRSLSLFDVKWSEYLQNNYEAIVADNDLIAIMDEFEETRTAVRNSIELRKAQIEKTEQFIKSEQFVSSQLGQYRDLKDKAFKLSLVKQGADALEKLKAKEKLDFADIGNAYQTAKEAAEINPRLKDRMDSLQGLFVEIQTISGEIQKMEFKPLMTRIKDYLMSIAAVSVIMMFLVFLGTYVKSVKSAKESAKQMKQLLNKGENEPPVI
ncbi:MAG: hypothetical protein MJY69_07510 [Bacteroidales bacterium]|nr:hypothetical protein [Bacteroidales bacterium]